MPAISPITPCKLHRASPLSGYVLKLGSQVVPGKDVELPEPQEEKRLDGAIQFLALPEVRDV